MQRALPALAEAAKLGAKAQKAGFDWPHWRDLLPKLAEETRGAGGRSRFRRSGAQAGVEAELGDLLFTVVNLGRHLGVDAEMALRGCNLRFRQRFREMELDVGAAARESLRRMSLKRCGLQAKRKLAANIRPEARRMIVIRNCEGFDELEACVQLQVETWGYDPTRRDSAQVVSAGAEDRRAGDWRLRYGDCRRGCARRRRNRWLDSLFSLPGVKTGSGEPRALSALAHAGGAGSATAIAGLGVQLKLEQRDEALSRGIRHMEWTFDPLEIKNAFLNIHKLGAIVCCYRVDFYGVSSSRLQGGLPTDRLLAEWQLDSPRVQDDSGRPPDQLHAS